MNTNLLDNAASFYSLFRANKLTPEIDQSEAIAVLQEIFEDRSRSATSMSLAPARRDAFLFFQGAYMGLLIMSKAYLNHLRQSAADQRIELPDSDSH